MKPRRRKRRIVSTGPSSASGGTTTLTREPSGRRASHSGSASSTRRPERREDALDRVPQLAVAREARLGGLEAPAALDPRGCGAADEHLVDLGVGEQRLERPEPEGALGDPRDERLARALVEHRRLAVHERPDALLRVLRRAGLGGLREHALAQRAREPVERGLLAGGVGHHGHPSPRGERVAALRRDDDPEARAGRRATGGREAADAVRPQQRARAPAAGAAGLQPHAQAGPRDAPAQHAPADQSEPAAAADPDADRRAHPQPQRHPRAAVGEPELTRRPDRARTSSAGRRGACARSRSARQRRPP